MKRSVFLGIALCGLWSILSVSGSAQILLNEVEVNPGGTDDGCEYVELTGTPGAPVENIHFVSLEGDSTKGVATAVITFGSPGPVLGSNGLLVVVSAAGCGARSYPAGTTVLATSFLNTGVLQNGSNSFLLISSATAITANTDYDTNDDGTLDALPAGAVILDGVAWSDGGATDVIYGTVLSAVGGTIGAATRFPGNTTANSAGAWYAGSMFGPPEGITYSDTVRTLNFPPDGALTPGAPNVGTPIPDSPVDINGDGKTDFVVVRAAGGTGSQLTWFNAINDTAPTSPREWGVSGDVVIAGDYDGDGVDDEAVFRPSNGTFYIILSATLTIRKEQFGQAGDDARVVGDYNGDGVDDIALYRPGAQGTWFYKTSPAELYKEVAWGATGDTPAPGDYDGDGKADFVVRRSAGGTGEFWERLSGGTFGTQTFGLATDVVVPGDYDGDGSTDICVVRPNAGFLDWHFEPSGTAGTTDVVDTWGELGDVIAPGDYDGDGKSDYAVWRPGATGTFYMMTVGTRLITTKTWGTTGDVPAAHYGSY